MKKRRLICALVACAAALGSIIPSARAVEVPDETIVWLEDMEWEWVDLSTAKRCETDLMPLTTDSIDRSVSKHSIGCVTQSIDFNPNDMITFNCSYSPSPASLDFSVIASNGKFYSINVKGGSINQTIGINEAGSYTVAIRNNSSQTVRVVGFVDY